MPYIAKEVNTSSRVELGVRTLRPSLDNETDPHGRTSAAVRWWNSHQRVTSTDRTAAFAQVGGRPSWKRRQLGNDESARTDEVIGALGTSVLQKESGVTPNDVARRVAV